MGNIAKKAFPVLNMHCAGCANNVEKTVKKLPGVVDASVNFASNTLTISYEDDTSSSERVCAYEATKYKLMQQINIIKRSTILFFI